MCFFSCCYDNIPNKSNLQKEWYILVQRSGQTVHHNREGMVARVVVRKQRADKK